MGCGPIVRFGYTINSDSLLIVLMRKLVKNFPPYAYYGSLFSKFISRDSFDFPKPYANAFSIKLATSPKRRRSGHLLSVQEFALNKVFKNSICHSNTCVIMFEHI